MRRVLGHFATGVTVVTAHAQGNGGAPEEPVGMVANSFTSLSLEPPLVLFCAGAESETWPRIRAADRFCINVLAHHQSELAISFARKGTDRYQGHGPDHQRNAQRFSRVDRQEQHAHEQTHDQYDAGRLAGDYAK